MGEFIWATFVRDTKAPSNTQPLGLRQPVRHLQQRVFPNYLLGFPPLLSARVVQVGFSRVLGVSKLALGL